MPSFTSGIHAPLAPKPVSWAPTVLVNVALCSDMDDRTDRFSATHGKDWQYVKFTEQMHHVLLPHEDGTFELAMAVRGLVRMVLKSLTLSQAKGGWKPAKINSEYEGRVAYSTNDLFVPHPEKPGLWKIHGRLDDQIMLSTGEKVRVHFPHVRQRLNKYPRRIQDRWVRDTFESHGGVPDKDHREYSRTRSSHSRRCHFWQRPYAEWCDP